jgi:hypothetical protein
VSLFVLSPEIEDRDEVEVELGQADYKKKKIIGHEFIYVLLVQLQ